MNQGAQLKELHYLVIHFLIDDEMAKAIEKAIRNEWPFCWLS